ncbi:MAG: metallophosphoesterase [Planctomycetota bacterium]
MSAEAFVVAQVSDLHLDRARPDAWEHLERAGGVLRKRAGERGRVDLLVVSGDLTDDGFKRPRDLAVAKAAMEAAFEGCAEAVWLLPGNHDVGDFVGISDNGVSSERVAAWREVVGPDWMALEWGEWLLLGIDAMVIGSGLAEEAEQLAWVRERVSGWSGHVGVFSHAPLVMEDWREAAGPATGYWLPGEAGRLALLEALGREPEFMASGHVHRCRLDEEGRGRWRWCPPMMGTQVKAAYFRDEAESYRTGFLVHELRADGRSSVELVEMGMETRVFEV